MAGPAGGLPDGRFPADPYPGATPGCSFVHSEATSHPLVTDASAFGGWRLRGGDTRPRDTHSGEDLDDWLARHGAAPMAGRVPVLTFGSNRCPSKLTWLREHLGLPGPVVMLRARVHGLAAVWAAGVRARDCARPATLAVSPGGVEAHSVAMATPEQVAVLDVCEGRGERYDLVRLHAGTVVTEDGAVVDDPWTYWPADPVRAPLLVDGRPVRCSELRQDRARDLLGAPAPLPEGVTTSQVGAPDPETWPARVFVYGTLQPGASAWPLMARHADGNGADGAVAGLPAAAWMPGRVHDTGRGYPALRPAAEDIDAIARGTVVPLRSPAVALGELDGYEGPEYRRVRSVTYRGEPPGSTGAVTGSICWVWFWHDATTMSGDWPVLQARWGATRAGGTRGTAGETA